MNGIYIHIPFCSSKCNYCTFASGYTGNEEEYFRALSDEIKHSYKPFLHVDTIYIGGGTPSKTAVGNIESLVKTLEREYDISAYKEFTIEANPESVTEDKISAYADMGINRLSLGVQSENDDVLSFLGRIHDSAMSVKALETIFRHFTNVSIDYIWGIEGNSIKVTLPEIFPVNHVSAYALSIDEGSIMKENRYTEKNEDDTVIEYADLLRQLREMGFKRYEVSNYARNGAVSVHNSLYWDRHNAYRGYGLSASSFYENRRMTNTWDMSKYLQGNICTEEEIIDKNTAYMESIMLGLRTSKGIDISLVNNAVADSLTGQGLAEIGHGRLYLTDKGFIVLDSIIQEIISEHK